MVTCLLLHMFMCANYTLPAEQPGWVPAAPCKDWPEGGKSIHILCLCLSA